MKLYATTISERASKGQGGNEHLDIKITDENNNLIFSFYILPKDRTGRYVIEINGNLDVLQQIETDIGDAIDRCLERIYQGKQKGKSQKGEIRKCKWRKCNKDVFYASEYCQEHFADL